MQVLFWSLKARYKIHDPKVLEFAVASVEQESNVKHRGTYPESSRSILSLYSSAPKACSRQPNNLGLVVVKAGLHLIIFTRGNVFTQSHVQPSLSGQEATRKLQVD